jgi:Ca-activated chloride channel family protein
MVLMLATTPSPLEDSQSVSAPATNNAPVRLTVTIVDKRGRYVTALSRDQITLLDEKGPLEITSFEQSDQPMSIGLVFDMSREYYAGLLASAKAALANFIKASEQDHLYFIVGFDRDPYLAVDWVRTTAEVAAGFDRLAGVRPSKKAALYDAIHAALVKVGGGPHPKRAIILISDGRNDGSKLKKEELFEAVRKSDALIYAVSAKRGDATSVGPSDYATLDKLCSMSGGFASSAATEAEFYEFFERLSVELKHQYSVSFIPADTGRGGEWRRLSFKAKALELKRTPSSKDVERIQLSVRGREGYYNQR